MALKWHRNRTGEAVVEVPCGVGKRTVLKLKCPSVGKEMKGALAWLKPLISASACHLCVLVQNGFQLPVVEGVSG